MSQAANNNPLDRTAAIVAAVGVSVIGALFYNLLPLFLGTIQDSYGYTSRQIGFIGSIFFLGFNIVTGSAFFWIRKFNWRHIALVATLAGTAGLLITGLSSHYQILIVAIFLCGGSFSALYGLGTIVLGDTSNPTRWYGVKISAEAGIGAILMFVLPGTLIAMYGFPGLVTGMLLTTAILAPLMYFLPEVGRKQSDVDSGNKDYSDIPFNKLAMWTGLIACVFFFTGQTAIWAFVERVGSSAGYSSDDVGTLLSVTLIFAILGSLLAAALGDRFGNRVPFILSCVCYLISLFLLNITDGFWFYAIGTCLVTFSFGGGLAFAVAEISQLDTEGQYVILTVPAIGLGAMLGPGIVGMLVQGNNYFNVLLFGGVIVTSALLLFASLYFFTTYTSSRSTVQHSPQILKQRIL